MRIELLGHAPTQAAMWSYLKDAGWAKVIKDDRGADMSVTADGVQLDIVGTIVETDNSDPENPVETKNTGGVHFNLRFYDDLAVKLLGRRAQTEVKNGESVQRKLFDRTTIKGDIEKALVSTLSMATRSAEGVKAGYEDATYKVRIFDPATIAKRTRVWA